MSIAYIDCRFQFAHFADRRRAAKAAAVAALCTPLPARALFGRSKPVEPPAPQETVFSETMDSDAGVWEDDDFDVVIDYEVNLWVDVVWMIVAAIETFVHRAT